MSSYEWMELQSLTADIAEARARLAEARSLKDNRLIRTLEQEITAAEAQRAKIVLQLSTHFADNNEQGVAAQPGDAEEIGAAADDPSLYEASVDGESSDDARPPGGPAAAYFGESEPLTNMPVPDEEDPSALSATEDGGDAPDDQWQTEEVVASATAEDSARSETTIPRNNVQGGTIVWDQLTPGDLERAKEELVARRTEMLARHAEELKALEADGSQLEMLEQAIAAFLQKFNAADADVVTLGDQRELRANRA